MREMLSYNKESKEVKYLCATDVIAPFILGVISKCFHIIHLLSLVLLGWPKRKGTPSMKQRSMDSICLLPNGYSVKS